MEIILGSWFIYADVAITIGHIWFVCGCGWPNLIPMDSIYRDDICQLLGFQDLWEAGFMTCHNRLIMRLGQND